MSFSFASRMARGGSRRDLWRHVARRALIIYGLGLFMAAYPRFDFGTVRLVGVLARIGMVYLVAGTLVLFLSRRAVFAVMLALLAGYWGPHVLGPGPGLRRGRPLARRQPGRPPGPSPPRGSHVERRGRRVRPRGPSEHRPRDCEHAGGTVCGRLPALGAPWLERCGGSCADGHERNRRRPPHAHGRVGSGSGRARLGSVLPHQQAPVDELLRGVHDRVGHGDAGRALLAHRHPPPAPVGTPCSSGSVSCGSCTRAGSSSGSSSPWEKR